MTVKELVSSMTEEELRAHVCQVEEYYYENGDKDVIIRAYMKGDQKDDN